MSHKMATTPRTRPLRADAERNQQRIVLAAQEAFAEQGLEVSMEEIARRAGVGPATLYRRFPGKQQLLRAVFDARLADLDPRISAAYAAEDPWVGLLGGVRAVLEEQSRNVALLQALAQAGVLPALKGELRERVFGPLCELFARAQAAGVVRADLDPSELPVLMRMVATTIQQHGDCPAGEARTSWPRYLALLADALRTPSPAPLPER
jgi:AcrR family transcriptional regulator